MPTEVNSHLEQSSVLTAQVHTLHQQFQQPDASYVDKCSIHEEAKALYRQACLHQIEALLSIMERLTQQPQPDTNTD